MQTQLKKLNGSKTVKEKILAVLSAEKKLSITDIHQHLLKKFDDSVSYQAVHKALNDLENNGVILKNENLFELNMSWIKQLKEYASTVESPVANPVTKINSNTDFSNPVKIEFKELSLLPVTFAQAFGDKIFTNGASSPVYSILRHGWWPYRFSFHNFFLLKRFLDENPGSKNIILENSLFDEWISKQYITAGSKSIYGVKFEKFDCDFLIHGDVVIQVYFSKETNELLDTVYSKISGITDLFAFYVNNHIQTHEVDVKVLIHKNPAIASMIKTKVDALFDGGSDHGE